MVHIYFYSLLFLLGISFGSFLNAWEWRIHSEKSISNGRSKCPTCDKTLKWYDNIPIVSFIFLRGKCWHCKKDISWQYPAVELVTGISFIFVGWFHQFDPLLIFRDCAIFFLLLFTFVYDFKYQLILDRMTLAPAGILFAISLLFGWHQWTSMLLGAVIGGGFFLAQFVLSKGKWIGGGDIRLGVFMGVILGWQLTLLALFLAYILGATVGVGLIASKKKKLASKVPFGTYLTIATFVAMFWGPKIISWYLGLII